MSLHAYYWLVCITGWAIASAMPLPQQKVTCARQVHQHLDRLARHLQVLCQAAPPCNQLPQEEVWTHKPAAAKEEDQIDYLCGLTQAGLHMQLLAFVVEQVAFCKRILDQLLQ